MSQAFRSVVLRRQPLQLENTQLRITTGLRVNGPKDDASNFAIATRLRGDIKGIEAVKIALATGDSIVNTAIQAGKSIVDLLTDMKAKVVQANQSGLDSASRTALNNDFTSLRDQLVTIVASAEFNNTNLITSGASTLESDPNFLGHRIGLIEVSQGGPEHDR